ncbi:MAG: hypothetical protein ABR609_10610 [Acidimicrobiia bacterium]
MLSETLGDASLLEVIVRAALPLVVLPVALLVILLLDRLIVLGDKAGKPVHHFPDFPEPVGISPRVEWSKRAA